MRFMPDVSAEGGLARATCDQSMDGAEEIGSYDRKGTIRTYTGSTMYAFMSRTNPGGSTHYTRSLRSTI